MNSWRVRGCPGMSLFPRRRQKQRKGLKPQEIWLKKMCDSSVTIHRITKLQKTFAPKKNYANLTWNICRNYCNNNAMSNYPGGISIPALLKTSVRSLEAFKDKSDLYALYCSAIESKLARQNQSSTSEGYILCPQQQHIVHHTR